MPGIVKTKVKWNWAKASGEVAEAYNKVIKKVNRNAPKIFKEEIARALKGDPKLKKYASHISGVNTVYSDMGLATKSTGVRAKIIDGELILRFVFTKRLGGESMYWSLIMAQHGRDEIRSNKLMPLVFDEKPYIAQGRTLMDPLNPGHYLVFTYHVREVKPWWHWEDMAIEATKNRIQSELFNSLMAL